MIKHISDRLSKLPTFKFENCIVNFHFVFLRPSHTLIIWFEVCTHDANIVYSKLWSASAIFSTLSDFHLSFDH